MSFTLTEFMMVVNLITGVMNDVCFDLDAIILISSTTPQVTLLDIPVIMMIYGEWEMLINGLRE